VIAIQKANVLNGGLFSCAMPAPSVSMALGSIALFAGHEL
jgi:hypothetical protein